MTVPVPPRPPLVDGRNAEMASAWNGAEGEDWAARAETYCMGWRRDGLSSSERSPRASRMTVRLRSLPIVSG